MSTPKLHLKAQYFNYVMENSFSPSDILAQIALAICFVAKMYIFVFISKSSCILFYSTVYLSLLFMLMVFNIIDSWL